MALSIFRQSRQAWRRSSLITACSAAGDNVNGPGDRTTRYRSTCRHGFASHIFIAENQRGGPCRPMSSAPIAQDQKSGPWSNIPSPTRNTARVKRARTIGLTRATIKITMANIACNICRLIYHETQRMKCA
ncbi:MAG: hypothetical protein GDA35_10835 [Hyphomonadaceae bacterium]|nr:hypothetical protein [Hyphomonadaceae bacterium]